MYLKRYVPWWIGMCALWFAAIYFPLHLLLLVLLVFFIVLMILRELPLKTLTIPKLIILSLVFQNTIIGLASHYSIAPNSNFSFFSQIPFIIISLSAAYILWHEYKCKKHILFWIYLLIIVLYCIKGNVRNITVLLYNIRNLIAFYLVFIIGNYCINDKKKLNEMRSFYINLAILAGIFGMIAILLGKDLYLLMGVRELYEAKTLGSIVNRADGLPGNFYGDFFGVYLLRMASFFLEPVNFSSYLSLAVILSACQINNIKNMVKFIFLILCNILTFGKGGLLIDTLTIGCLLAGNLILKIRGAGLSTANRLLKIGVIVGGAGLGILYGTIYSYNYHFYTIKKTISTLIQNPFGFGVGTVGNVSFVGKVAADMKVGAETGLLNFWCQIGIFGLIIFVMLLFRMSNMAFSRWQEDDLRDTRMAFCVLPIILLVVFVFQENIFTVQVITGFMLFQGYFSQKVNRRSE